MAGPSWNTNISVSPSPRGHGWPVTMLYFSATVGWEISVRGYERRTSNDRSDQIGNEREAPKQDKVLIDLIKDGRGSKYRMPILARRVSLGSWQSYSPGQCQLSPEIWGNMVQTYPGNFVKNQPTNSLHWQYRGYSPQSNAYKGSNPSGETCNILHFQYHVNNTNWRE